MSGYQLAQYVDVLGKQLVDSRRIDRRDRNTFLHDVALLKSNDRDVSVYKRLVP
jgi:hypothetical protein